MMKQLSIGEVSRRAGVAASAVRYYESIDLLPAPTRVSGQRKYGMGILNRLKIISVAKSLDFTLDEIRQLFEGVSEKSAPTKIWREFARVKLDDIEKQILRANQLRDMLNSGLTCKCLKLSDCLAPDPDRDPGHEQDSE